MLFDLVSLALHYVEIIVLGDFVPHAFGTAFMEDAPELEGAYSAREALASSASPYVAAR